MTWNLNWLQVLEPSVGFTVALTVTSSFCGSGRCSRAISQLILECVASAPCCHWCCCTLSHSSHPAFPSLSPHLQFGKAAAANIIQWHRRQLPSPNLVPPSLHLMRAIVEAEDWSQYQLHVCSRGTCTGHVWDYLPKADWQKHFKDVCPKCQGPRFKDSSVSGMRMACHQIRRGGCRD